MNTEIAEYIKNHIREYLPPEYPPTNLRIVITAGYIIESRFGVVVVPTVAHLTFRRRRPPAGRPWIPTALPRITRSAAVLVG